MNDEFDVDLEGRIYEEIDELITDFLYDKDRHEEILRTLEIPVNGATLRRVEKAISNGRDSVRELV